MSSSTTNLKRDPRDFLSRRIGGERVAQRSGAYAHRQTEAGEHRPVPVDQRGREVTGEPAQSRRRYVIPTLTASPCRQRYPSTCSTACAERMPRS